MTVLSTLGGRLKNALKVYLVFAVLHSLYKIVSRWVKIKRFQRMTAHLPGQPMDHTGKTFRANIMRIHEWSHEHEISPFAQHPLIRRSSPEPVVTCNDGEMIKFILKDGFKSFTKPSKNEDPLFRLLDRFLGKGIFVVRHGVISPGEDKLWYQQRKTASKVFTRGNFLKGMRETFVAKGHNFIRVLEDIAAKNSGVVGNQASAVTAVDMQEKFFSFTFDSIQKIFFGKEVNSLLGEKDVYAAAFDRAHNSMVVGMFSNILYSILQKHVLPFPFGDLHSQAHGQNLVAYYLDHTDPHMKRFHESVAYLKEETVRRVQEARADPDLPNRKDMMSTCINAGSFDDAELADLVLNFIIAGRDTTACTLSWMFFELSINPDVQARLAEELDRVFGGRAPTMEELSPENTPVLNGVLYETFRKHPPVPAEMKMASENVTFPDGTTIPKGTKCTFHPYSIGRDEVKYPDPERFVPDRWIPFSMPDAYDFPVFQAGPRLCLGKDFAIFEAKLLAAMLLQKFTFALLDGERDKISYSLSLTMSIVNSKDKTSDNLWLVPRPREPSHMSQVSAAN